MLTRSALTLLLFAATLGGLTQWARRMRRMPLPLGLATGFALLVCIEGLLVHALSMAHALSAIPLMLGHVLLIAATLRPARPPRPPLRALLLLPLFALILVSATRYAPNNWDAMTYHLARVAHWIQNGSVDLYPSSILRQNAYAAGEEYVLLALLLGSGSDQLAFVPQGCAWLVFAAAAPTVARLAGAPARLSRWAFVVAGALPMAVLQASSTQNDLTAAVMTLGAGAATLPFLHRRDVRPREGLLLGACVAASALVKMTALVAIAPLLLIAAAQLLARGTRRPRALVPGVLALLIAAALYAPDWPRFHLLQENPEHMATWSFPLLGEWQTRGQNLLRSPFRHLPPPGSLAETLQVWPCDHTQPLCTLSLSSHEDVSGNPLAAALAVGLLGWAAFSWRRLSTRARGALVGALGAWVLFGAMFRDNPWVTRLELPVFALWPLLLAVFERRRVAPGWIAVGCTLALAHGLHTAANNVRRPPLTPRAPDWALAYYDGRNSLYAAHEATLELARARGCKRLGLVIDENACEYPLTWRAMQAGLEVRHVTPADPWPCVVYTSEQTPPAPWKPAAWEETGSGRMPRVFVRD